MKSSVNRKLAIGAAAVLVLGGAGAAVAATHDGSGSNRQAFVDDVAKRVGVSPGTLTAAMKAAAIDRVEAAVAAGHLSQAQATVIKQRIASGAGTHLFGLHYGGRHDGPGAVAVHYLGISPATLRSERASGKSLAQIASTTPGKSAEGLKASMIAAARAKMAAAVSSGRITATEAKERLGALDARVEAMLQRTGPPGGRHAGMRGVALGLGQ